MSKSPIAPCSSGPLSPPAVQVQPPLDRVQNLLGATDKRVVEFRHQLAKDALAGDPGIAPNPLSAAPTYFKTYTQVNDWMAGMVKSHPELKVRVEDIGDSGRKVDGKPNGRDVFLFSLTSPKARAEKAKMLLVCGIHAREISNPHVVQQWLETLANNYGKDPAMTALLDNVQFDVVLLANPDGREIIEAGYKNGQQSMQRKTAPSSWSKDGTDGNRNCTGHWGGPGASSSPSSDTYRGPSAASEPETKAYEALLERKEKEGNQYNLVVDIHSYSGLVLTPPEAREYPIEEKAKAAYKNLAEQCASLSGYTPEAGYELYDTSGTTELAWTKYKIPYLTFETGQSFHQSDAEFAKVKKETIDMLTYVSKIADDPLGKSKGPEVTRVSITPSGKLQVQASVAPSLRIDWNTRKLRDDRSTPTVVAAEYTFDPHAKGAGTPLTPADGACDNADEMMEANVSRDLGKNEGTIIYLRAKDSNGNWGPYTAEWLKPNTQE